MDMNGPERKSLAQSLPAEDFLIHVATEIENQLKEWNSDYEVMVMKLQNYIFVVKYQDEYYELAFNENNLKILQKKDPYELDRMIWKDLESKGIAIVRGNGSYIDMIM
ncbi:hypothetical protein [Bacillus tuaregi]|uniref:hypothetical protein n=1 Tax=Bacillus tuaregi TaxID=1816695 RepID=UPI0008F903C3|nr:hypothetical protein [Bacillus tuaregi]